MKNIIITGGTGFFGTNFYSQFKKKYNIFLLGNKRKTKIKNVYYLDLNNTKKLENFFLKKKIDTLIHSAAMSNVDECEKYKKKCFMINSELPIKISNLSQKCGIKFVFLSSDQLFSLNKNFKSENSTTNPINCYGKSKIKAENGILKNNNNALIIRTNFFGFGPLYRRSFSDWIIDNLRRNNRINLYEDIYFNPLFIKYLNTILIKLVSKNLKGIYNLSSDNKISKYHFGIKIAKNLNLNLNIIKKTKFNSRNHFANRPKNMCLNNSRIKKILNIKKISIDDQIKKMLKEVKNYEI